MTTRSGCGPHTADAQLDCGSEQRRPARRRGAWLGALPPLVWPIAQTMPWVTLIAGCVAGLTYIAILAAVADAAHWSLTQGDVRFAFIPAVAALAFVVRGLFRPLTEATPVPAWVARVGCLVLTAPVLAATCWAELGIVGHTIRPHTGASGAAVYPLIAQLTGWCAITVAVAAGADRSRYADLGGAIALPVSFAAIALGWFLPATARFLVEPAATPHDVTVAWYAVAAAALGLTCMAMRDRWHRYTRVLHRVVWVQQRSSYG